jgi:hypothetical protein
MWTAICGAERFNSAQLTRRSECRVEFNCCRCVTDAESVEEAGVVHQLYMIS